MQNIFDQLARSQARLLALPPQLGQINIHDVLKTKLIKDWKRRSGPDFSRAFLVNQPIQNSTAEDFFPKLCMLNGGDYALARLHHWHFSPHWLNIEILCSPEHLSAPTLLHQWLLSEYGHLAIKHLCIWLNPNQMPGMAIPNAQIRAYWMWQSSSTQIKMSAPLEHCSELQLVSATAKQLYPQYRESLNLYNLSRRLQYPLYRCQFSDLKKAEEQGLLWCLKNQSQALGFIAVQRKQMWHFEALHIIEKCLFTGFLGQGLGSVMERYFYQQIASRSNDQRLPILGLIQSWNLPSLKCALRYGRQALIQQIFWPFPSV